MDKRADWKNNSSFDLLKIDDLTEEEPENRLIIVYHGERIETEKNIFFFKCRFFRKQKHLFEQKENDLSDKYSTETFRSFIFSMKSREIELRESNVFELLELSSRYEYHELFLSLQKYLSTCPFFTHLLNEIISNEKENNALNENYCMTDEIYSIISKHFDQSIKSGLLLKFKYSTIYRFLKSPSLVVKDHHLLFEFILTIFDEFQKTYKDRKENERKFHKQKLILQSFTSFLDYNEINEEEVERLIQHLVFCDSYQPKHSSTLISRLIIQQHSNETLISQFEKKVEQQSSIINSINNLIKKQLSDQKKEIEALKSEFAQQLKEQCKYLNTKILYLKKSYDDIKQNELIIRSNDYINKHFEKRHEKNSKHIKNEYNDKLYQEISLIKSIIKDRIPTFNAQYVNSERSFQGSIYELTRRVKKNVYEAGIVDITGNPSINKSFSILFDYNDKEISYFPEDKVNSYLCFDFKDHQITLSHYSIKSGKSFSPDFLRSWIIEGSNDKQQWDKLDSHNYNQTFCYERQVETFEIEKISQSQNKYRFIQLKMTGPSSRG
ncbi:hypothetical protein TRFO_09039 [Tritrichomonas foetus]|uniref:BTB domain-containing protein n=1 Tax=Tritrichomonas foetus TaxID=1144522 RepID=A0A1J4JGA9_9EUKA|nr:hypothetical protein TRFO_09039 [Tritrichomonas foetus]|eukprot:OHS98178.1 hypothetical protein TRFO_09039 [Tritrichomonas foetus]